MLSQSIVANCAVESLNVGILLGLVWLNVFQSDTAFFCPGQHYTTDVFGVVVYDDYLIGQGVGHGAQTRIQKGRLDGGSWHFPRLA